MMMQLFVPWTSKFDQIIVKKTVVKFRMLDNEWTALSPNRDDCRPYRGSNVENEKFYGGKSIVFCVSEDFFQKDANDIELEICVEKNLCEYFEMDPCQNIGHVPVPVNGLLNSISKQIRERNELAAYLSEFYKRQIISR